MQTTTQTTKIIIGALIVLILIGIGMLMNKNSDTMRDTDSVATTTIDTTSTNEDNTKTAVKAVNNRTASTKTGGKGTITTVTPKKNPLAGTSWIWKDTAFQNKSASILPANNVFVITFGTDGAVTSSTDCNSISGRYAVTNDRLTISALAGTRKACAAPTLEATYTQELAQVTTFGFESLNELDLNLGNTGTMSFQRR